MQEMPPTVIMYADDTFYTLAYPEQLGLALLSTGLAGGVLLVAWQLMVPHGRLIRMAIAVSLFYLFVWLSPQAYYTYYLMVLDGLAWQIVVKPARSPQAVVEIVTFQGPSTLAAPSKGLLALTLMLIALGAPRS